MSGVKSVLAQSFLTLVEDVFQCLGWETAESALRGYLTSVPESEVCIRWKSIDSSIACKPHLSVREGRDSLSPVCEVTVSTKNSALHT
jgi:hypothetical protein